MMVMRMTALLAVAVGAHANNGALSEERLAAITELKNSLHTMTAEEATAAFARLGAKHRLHTPNPRQKKIDHMVVLYQENRAADHLLGCVNGDREGFDGIPTGGRLINKVPFDPSQGQVNVSCGTAPYVCGGADAEAEARTEVTERGAGQQPLYDTFAGHFKPGSNALKFPYANQSDEYSYLNGATGGSIQMFGADQVPIKKAISENFGVFNKLFCAVPSSSTPNHHFTQSGTSCGSTNNNDYQQCGGKTLLFPQMAMYDTMWLDNVSFGFYMNSTCDSVPGSRGEHPCNSVGPTVDTSPVYAPDATIAGVARYTDHFYSHTQFYKEAAEGTLPNFSWLNCKEEACDHPCNDVAKGERCQKDVYEALRAGPKWSNTLMVVVYDDAGGFYDHVIPPYSSPEVPDAVPDDEAPCQAPCRTFDFRRLGLRTTGMMLSPWVKKGDIFQEPKAPFGIPGRSPYNTSQFELTSIAASVKHLFNLSMFLTKRDAWAGNFEELLLDEPRPDSDMPMHLPDAPALTGPGQKPWSAPPAALPAPYDPSAIPPLTPPPPMHSDGKHWRALMEADADAHDEGELVPQHCSAKGGTCDGLRVLNVRQRRYLKLYSKLTMSPEPQYEGMSWADGEEMLSDLWKLWQAQGSPTR